MWTGGGEGNWGAWPLQQSAYANLPHQKGTHFDASSESYTVSTFRTLHTCSTGNIFYWLTSFSSLYTVTVLHGHCPS